MNSYTDKIASLREAMRENKTDAYLIPSTDPHLGEYTPDHWRIIEWMTGFTGSSATVVITDSFAGLWTDSRYFIQADDQLKGSGISLMKPLLYESIDFTDWLKDNIEEGNTIALDGRTFSVSRLRKLEDSLKGQHIRIDTEPDLISTLWTDRPPMPDSMAFDHDIAFCGLARSLKISQVREQMKLKGVNYHFLTSLDDIMWMLNIRGRDVKYSPLLTSYALIGEDQILLFADESKIPLKLASEFDKLNILILPYEETAVILSTLPGDSVIFINPSTTSATLYRSIPKGMTILEGTSIPSRLKAIKNKTEIANIGKVMVRDGIALTRFFFWLEKNDCKIPVTELAIADKLNELRSAQNDYLGPSFQTIAAFNEHGALPHYSATPVTDYKIDGRGILLIDSGGSTLAGLPI